MNGQATVIGGIIKINNEKLQILEINGKTADITQDFFSPTSRKRIISAIIKKEKILRSVRFLYKGNEISSDCVFYYSKQIVFQLINLKIKVETDNFSFIYDIKKNLYRFVKKTNLDLPYKFTDEEKQRFKRRINRSVVKTIRTKENQVFDFSLTDLENNLVFVNVYVSYPNQKFIKIAVFDNTKQHDMINKMVQAEKLQSLGNMAGGLAHDLNNQLMVIEGYTNLINKKGDEDLKKYTKNIYRAINSSSELIKKLLTFSLQNTMDLVLTDISSLLEEMKIFCKRVFSYNYKLIFNNRIYKAIALADKTSLENSLLNIIKNACEAFDKEENILMINLDIVDLEEVPEGIINYNEDIAGRFIRIDIIDNGCGINQGIINKVCDPFFTTKKKSEQTGLGLSTVLGNVIQHNGMLAIVSKPEIGTKVSIFLKAVEEMKQLSFELEEVKRKILVIDDEELIRSVMEDLLYEIGYDCLSFSNAYEAIKYYEKNHEQVDLIICDMIMPGLSGKDTYYELIKINQNLKFILLSGYSMNEVDDLFRTQISDFISKPVSISSLENSINKILKI